MQPTSALFSIASPTWEKRWGKRRADPFVVGLSLTYNMPERPWIVVTTETKKRRPQRKIPYACEILGLPCVTLAELIERELRDDDQTA
jgi:hypothetical protein